MHRALRAGGLILLLLTLTCAFLPVPQADDRISALALRQLGHDYLLASGDATSTVPPVRERKDGSWILPLGRPVDYDSLALLSRAVMKKYGIGQAYTLALEDCASGELVLGSLWPGVADAEGDGAACVGRDQVARCANISLAIPGGTVTASPPVLLFLGGLGVLLLLVAPIRGPGKEALQPTVSHPESEPDALQIPTDCTLHETALLLRVGSREAPVTYREAKLLTFLARHPNEVLTRAVIHDAVWGAEGIITGRSLDVFVSRLRKKLSTAEGVEIQTVHGVGYRFWLANPAADLASGS